MIEQRATKGEMLNNQDTPQTCLIVTLPLTILVVNFYDPL